MRSAALSSIVTALALTCPESPARAEPVPDTRPDPGVSSANVAVLPCRPTIACTTELVPPGTLELEAGWQFKRLPASGDQHSTPLLFKYTLTPSVQLQLFTNGVVFTSMSGTAPQLDPYLDDVAPLIKWRLRGQTDTLPSVAVSGAIFTPTLQVPEAYVRTVDVQGIVYITKNWGSIQADLNVGATVFGIDRQPVTQPYATLAVGWPLSSRLGLGAMVEPYYFAGNKKQILGGILTHDGKYDQTSDAVARDAGFLAAVSWSPSQRLMFDVGADLGIDGGLASPLSFLGEQPRKFTLFAGLTTILYTPGDR